jgi:hypothetical protein
LTLPASEKYTSSFASRPWALLVLGAPYRLEELNRAEGRRHKSPNRFTMQLMASLIHWFPQRKVILVGDGGDGLVPVRWVFVHGVQGTHSDEYLYSTDPTSCTDRIVSFFAGRWSIKVTFQEVCAHLGFTTPRNWSKPSVLRTAPAGTRF